MPELRVKELRFPEIHLPEMTREDIARTINDARSEIDFSRIERPEIDLSRSDIGRFVTSAAESAGLITVTRRPRPMFVVGLAAAIAVIIAAVVAATILGPRIAEARRRAAVGPDGETRGDIDATASDVADDIEAEVSELAADASDVVAAAPVPDEPATPVAIPIEPSAFPDPDVTERATTTEPAAHETAVAERVFS